MLFAVGKRVRRWPSTASSSQSSHLQSSRRSRCCPTASEARSRTSPAFSRDDSRPVHESYGPGAAGCSLERGRNGGRALAFDGLGRSALPPDRPAHRSRLLVLPPPVPRRARRERSRLGPLEKLGDDLQVGQEGRVLLLTARGLTSEDRARVNRREHVLGQV